MQYVAVAQLDRVSDSDSEGRRFESCQPYHVAADAISFAATIFLTEQSSLLTHSVAAPFQSRSPVLRDCYFKTGRKVRFAPALSISRGIESTVRPLPCSSSPNRSRSAGLRFGIWYGPADNISFAATFFAKLTFRSFCRGSVQTRKAGLQLCCLEEQFLCL